MDYTFCLLLGVVVGYAMGAVSMMLLMRKWS
jgi:hypothetical protein